MKKVFFLVLFLLFHIGYSQQITHIQYWFGNDFSGRVLQSVSSNGNNQTLFDISFPDNGTNELDTYFHCRFVDSNNNWSAIYSQEMTNANDASTSLVRVEYWFDADFANKTIADITTVLISNELDHQELDILWPENAQEFHYRFKSSYNKWSSVQSSDVATTIFQNNQIVAVEYWFDDDFINRLPPQPITANANNQINFDIPFPDNGSNQLDAIVHYRFVDGIGNWSAIYSEEMINNNETSASTVELEYWFDDNFSGRLIVPTTQFLNGTQIEHQEASLLWQENAQTIHYRFKSKYNQWSSILSLNIDTIENRDNKIVELEWWINDNFTNRELLSVTQTGDAFLDIRDLTLDPAIQNTIYVRYKDKMNRWSSIFSFFPTEPGITVLVHGFQFTGEVVIDPILTDPLDDFKKMGAEIINRAGGGVMFVNNPDNGQIEFVDNNAADWSYTLNNKKEIVLVYDWRDLSNNNVVNIDFGSNGYLESAADNLLASILNVPNALWGEAASLTREQLLAKPKHFIAHSRGNILTLQLLHRLATYFQEVKVDHFTLLDPHPATSFGDMNSNQDGSPPNLPCVNGVATNCISPFGCFNVDFGAYLKIPYNVTSADNYFRRDGLFEGTADIGAFDGLPVSSLGFFNRELNDVNLGIGAPLLGGTHSAVHKWYRGTINYNINPALPDENGDDSGSAQNTLLWYTTASVGSTTTLEQPNDFLQTENRFTTGFNRSRIGGGEPITTIPNEFKESLTEMNKSMALRYGLSLTEYPNGVSPHTVDGGYFDNNNDAGWKKNGGSSFQVSINNGKAQIYNDFLPLATHSILKHSLMYFAPIYNFVKINIYDSNSNSTIEYPSIKVTFFNHENVQIGSPYTKILSPSIVEQFIPLPNELKGEVGTFQIEYETNTTGSFKVDEIKLVESISTINLKLYIEGYYDTTIHKMRSVKSNQGVSTDTTLVDEITVDLVHPTTLIKAASSIVEIRTNGTAFCNFSTVTNGTYYIVVKHRNTLQTWSSTPVLISDIPSTYDFSNSVSKAYGDNMKELESGIYGLYSGDINQDEFIDASDYSLWETDSNQFSFGSSSTDLNGDGIVDATDYSIWEGNNNDYILSIHP